MKIIVASTNPVKIEAARRACEKVFGESAFDIQGIDAVSGVRDQPMSSDEALQGAKNRVAHAKQTMSDADVWVAFEGGVEEMEEGLSCFAWAAVTDGNQTGMGKSATFFLPPKVAELVRGGMELGKADDLVFARENTKQVNGAIGLLTHDAIDRTTALSQAAILALIPFVNKELY